MYSSEITMISNMADSTTTENPFLNAFSYPGTFNTTCQFATDCFTQLNLQCVDGICLCTRGYFPNSSGGCQVDPRDLLIVWAIRFGITAVVLLFCVAVLYIVFHCNFRCGGSRRETRNNLLEGGESRVDTCCHEEPPPYVEVISPPPTYSEAIAKMTSVPIFDEVSVIPQVESNSNKAQSDILQDSNSMNCVTPEHSQLGRSSALSKNGVPFYSSSTVECDITIHI